VSATTRGLDLAALASLPRDVARPAFDPAQVDVGIVHLGIGAFHRAHQAIYTDDAIARAGGAWGICGVSLRSPDVRDRMRNSLAEGERGSIVDLQALIEPGSGINVDAANQINDKGEILGSGVLPNGERHAILLIPRNRD